MKPTVANVPSWIGVPSGNKTPAVCCDLETWRYKYTCNVSPNHAMKVYCIEGDEVQLHSLLTSALDGGERLTSSPPPALIPPRKNPGTKLTGEWVVPAARLGVLFLSGFEPRTVRPAS